MKFVQALLLASSVSAIRLTKKDSSKPEITAEDVVKHIFGKCDKNKDQQLTWDEAKQCGAPADLEKKFKAAAGEDGMDAEEMLPIVEAEMAKRGGNKGGKKGGKKLAQGSKKMPKAGQMWELLTSLMDQNDDGVIQGQEAQAALDWFNQHAEAVFDHIDANDDGAIDKKEFVSAWDAQFAGENKLAQKKPTPEEIFDHMDADGSGHVTQREIVDAIKLEWGAKAPADLDEKVEDLFEACFKSAQSFTYEQFEANLMDKEARKCVHNHIKGQKGGDKAGK